MEFELNYNMITHRIETQSGFEWCAKFPTLQGVIGTGNTQEKAIQDLIINAQAHLLFLQQENEIIPEFDNFEVDDYSGKISLRMPKSLHKNLSKKAKEDNVSLNSYINHALSSFVSKTPSEYQVLYSKIEDTLNKINSNLLYSINNKTKFHINED